MMDQLQKWIGMVGAKPVLLVIGRSLKRASEAGFLQAATSISYYSLFSIIPFLLIALTISSMFAETVEIQEQIVAYILGLIPKMSQDLITTNLENLLGLRGQVRVISLLVFLWGAVGAFSTLIINLDKAGQDSRERFLFRSHVKAVALMTGLAILLPLSFIAKGLIQLILELDLPILRLEFVQNINPLIYLLLPYVLLFSILTMIYRWGPRHDISWRNSAISALVITLMQKATSWAFTAYLAQGISKYNVLYGTLGAVLVLLFWLFLVFSILLYGAHLAATLEYNQLGGESKSPGS